MLLLDKRKIGNRLLAVRRRAGLTQMEAAEAAGLSGRTYADIERGSVNMRAETILRICAALHITPNDILTEDGPAPSPDQAALLDRLNTCSQRERETALRLLAVYFQSLD